MRAGALRTLVHIMEPIETRNSFRELVQSWTLFQVAWASVEDLTGREFFASQQMQGVVTTRFRVRYMAGIRSDMRIHVGGIVYEIVSPPQDPDGRKRELVIMAKREG
jgi:SPP1 family predicted phage head-tail adaptor